MVTKENSGQVGSPEYPSWGNNLEKEKGPWVYEAFSRPIGKEGFIDYWCFSSSQGDVKLNIRVKQRRDNLGSAWYDEKGFLHQVNVYPLTSGNQKYLEEVETDRLIRAAGLESDFEQVIERVEELRELNAYSSLLIEQPRQGDCFFQVKGVLGLKREAVEELAMVERGEMIRWDEYDYCLTEKKRGLMVEVFLPLQERKLIKRLVFPLRVDYDQISVFKDGDGERIAGLVPVEVEFPPGSLHF